MSFKKFIDLLNYTNDLTKIIEIRTNFRKQFPEEFARYMKAMEQSNKGIIWSGCFDCKHFQSGCSKGLSPEPLRKTTDKSEYFCSHFQKRV